MNNEIRTNIDPPSYSSQETEEAKRALGTFLQSDKDDQSIAQFAQFWPIVSHLQAKGDSETSTIVTRYLPEEVIRKLQFHLTYQIGTGRRTGSKRLREAVRGYFFERI